MGRKNKGMTLKQKHEILRERKLLIEKIKEIQSLRGYNEINENSSNKEQDMKNGKIKSKTKINKNSQSKEKINNQNHKNLDLLMVEKQNKTVEPVFDTIKIPTVEDIDFTSNQWIITQEINLIPKYKIHRSKKIIEQRNRLPILYDEEKIVSTIIKNKITLISGSTGCGKTTQIPQILLDRGFENICMTQPRRLVTISIADRINKELGEVYKLKNAEEININNANKSSQDLSENRISTKNRKLKNCRIVKPCAYNIKYESTVDKNTIITVMTDGILLNEIKKDFLLKKYDVIIIDEIHERNINIDIILPFLFKIIKLRDDLRLVLTSATFCGLRDLITAYLKYEPPLITIKSSIYPVKVFYESEISEGIENLKNNFKEKACEVENGIDIKIQKNRKCDYISLAIEKIFRILEKNEFVNILVFLATKSEISQILKLLENSGKIHEDLQILPLHADLSRNSQKRVLKKGRKIILSTNIAESGITIPDITHIIDTGLQKRCVFDKDGTKTYFIDYISKSSADQRLGRAGRTCPGTCYRLYTGNIHSMMPESKEPEIFTSRLDKVVIYLKSVGIKNQGNFPFLEFPPDIERTVQRLIKMEIFDDKQELTPLGRKISHFPIEPELSKILCLKNINEAFFLICAILECNLEIHINNATEDYFINTRSNLISKYNILKDFKKTANRKVFCTDLKINYSRALEVLKLENQLMGIRNRIFKNANIDNSYDPDEIRRKIFLLFERNLCQRKKNLFYFKDKIVHLPKNSIPVLEKDNYFVFEHLVSRNNKLYPQNITIVDDCWLSNAK